MSNIPIIKSLAEWIGWQGHGFTLTVAASGSYVNIHHGKTWLGVVTLIYPGQDQKQALQYDWYAESDTWPLLRLDPDSRYYRSIWQIADPSSFPEILEVAQAISSGSSVKWQEVYRPTKTGLQLVEGANA